MKGKSHPNIWLAFGVMRRPTGPLSSETRLCMRRFRARRHKPQPKSSNFVKLLHNYHHHYNYYHHSPDCSAPHSNRVLTDFG